MAVAVRNMQRKLPVDVALLQQQASQALHHLSASAPSASLTLATDFHVQVLNAKYALRRAPTDVLTFRLADAPPSAASPALEDHLRALRAAPYLHPESGQLLPPAAPARPTVPAPGLGAVFLAVPYCHRVARERAIRSHEYLLLAAVHGLAHLVGHVHNTPASRAEMKDAEIRVIEQLRDTYHWQLDQHAPPDNRDIPFMPRSYLP